MIKNKPQFDKTRALSWSGYSSFKWDPEQWYSKYVMGIQPPETAEMKFGKTFAQSIEDGTCKVKELMKVLQQKKEYKFETSFGEIPLIGYGDAFCIETFRILDEVKTGKKPWDQKRADGHGQFDMYLLMNYLINKVKPDEVRAFLRWIPTQDNGDYTISFVQPVKVYSFETKRSMAQVLKFGTELQRTWKEMESYAKSHA